jgi:protein involved in polysaccharide export with SLBB domain
VTVTTSTLEKLYFGRGAGSLKQFGYDLVGNGGTPWVFNSNGTQVTAPVGNGGTISNLQIGAVQDDYILGPGDQLSVTFRGHENSSFEVEVARDGTVTLPALSPIAAAGRSFADFRSDLERKAATTYLETKAFVSVTQIRQLSVRVVGEVPNPGTYSLTGLSTVLDALNLAGGIKKSGSLRNVTVVRGNRTFKIDLYTLLLSHGPTPDMTVAQNDRIVIPAIGTTVAVAGDVRRPAIYELPPGETAIKSSDAVALADGPQLRGVYRETLLQIRPDGRQELVDIPNGEQAAVRDGEILTVRKAIDYSLGRISLAGDVRLPGDFALADKKTLHDLLNSFEAFGPNPYLLLGVIDRIDPSTLQHIQLVFSPLRVIQSKENQSLINSDTVRIFSVSGVRALAAGPAAVATLQGYAETSASASPNSASTALRDANTEAGAKANTEANTETSTETNTTALSNSASTALRGAVPSPSVQPTFPIGILSSDVGGLDPGHFRVLSSDLSPYGASIAGAVHQPGNYLVAPNTTVDQLVGAAGGLDANADLSGFEITSTITDGAVGRATSTRNIYSATPSQLSQITLKGLDDVIFHQVYTDQDPGEVTIAGEVRFPGHYHILRGEKLTSLIARAGGYGPAAYPYGAVFTRQSVAKLQSDAFISEANEMESSLAANMLSGRSTLNSSAAAPTAVGAGLASSGTTAPNGASGGDAAYLESLAAQLRGTKPVGRIAINADLVTLKKRPDLDFSLEPGDSLTIPRKSATVNVVGEVRNPGGILFDNYLTPFDYISAAGGETRLADEGDAFIILPDGNTTPLRGGFFSIGTKPLAPGSTIVVPRDVTPPIDWLDLTTRVVTIVSQVALTAASLAILSHN